MATIRGRSRMSSRGQIVIPKTLRDAAGLAEGDEVEVIFDGQRLILAPCRRGQGRPSADGVGFLSESQEGYEASRGPVPRHRPDEERPSKIWAARMRAAANIEQLSRKFRGIDFEELWAEARRELRGEDSGE